MLKYIFPTFFLIFFTFSLVLGQVIVVDKEIENLPKTIVSQLNSIGTEQSKNLAIAIEKHWNSGKATVFQKKKWHEIALTMQAKNYKPSPQLIAWYDCLRFLYNNTVVTESQIDQFLDLNILLFSKNETKVLPSFWERTKLWAYNGTISQATNCTWYLKNADISFQYFKVDSLAKSNELPINNQQIIATNDGWDDPIPVLGQAAVIIAKPDPLAYKLNNGPIMKITNGDLILVTPSDSVIFTNNNAQLGFVDNAILGAAANFNWAQLKLPQYNSSLGSFWVDLKNPKLFCPDSKLKWEGKLEAPIDGVFEYKSTKRAKNTANTYPRFISLSNNIVLKGLQNNLVYTGGVSLMADKMYSGSYKNNVASLRYFKDAKLQAHFQSKKFVFEKNKISSDLSSLTIYLESDSILHQGLKIAWDTTSNFIQAYKQPKATLINTKYVDYYHKMTIDADAMRWFVNDDKMDFYILSGKRVVPAIIESFDFYDLKLLPSLSGSYGFNPMVVLNNYLKSNGQNQTYLGNLATFTKKDIELIKNIYLELKQKDLVNITADETIEISKKGQHYLNVIAGKKDYDNFLIPSFYMTNAKDSTANVTLNFNSKKLIINGVTKFSISDSLQTSFTPSDGKVELGKDRNFKINGLFESKNYKFKGSEFEFDYDRFALTMNKIDAITFIPQKQIGKNKAQEVGGNLKYESGTIFINRPNNKSGRIQAAEYPKLSIQTGLTVYFDQPERQNGVYLPAMYFKIPKIENDSLNKKDLSFAGTFYGAGIVPDFDTYLVTMPDNSLGFIKKYTNPEKIKLYGGSSYIVTKELKMDNAGLTAAGDLQHLKANFKASNIVIYPDSVVAIGKSGLVEEGNLGQVYFPKVALKDFSLKYKPSEDSLIVKSERKSAFEIFNENNKLFGDLVLRKTGVEGIGTLKRADAEVISEQLKFSQNQIFASDANVKVGTLLASFRPVISSERADFNFNIKSNIVKLTLNKKDNLEDTTAIYLPYSQFKTSISVAEYDIIKKQITMKGRAEESVFTSTLAAHEGLAINASGAIYDLPTNTLNLSGIPYIDLVDSRLKPKGGLLIIKKDGDIQKTVGARLEVDSVTANHVLVDANIKIASKNSFQGDAKYRFINAKGDSVNIKITSFNIVENASGNNKLKSYTTTAKASITEKDKFFVSPKIQFQGEISMMATNPSLSMEGFVRPFIKKRKDLNNWIPFKGTNQDGVRISINDSLKSDLGQLYAGWHYRNNGGGVYTSFLSPKESPDDQNIFLATGGLAEDVPNNRFEVSQPNQEFPKYYYNDAQNVINLSGKFNFFGNEVVKIAGEAKIVPDSSIYKAKTITILTAALPKDVLSAIAGQFVKYNINESTGPEVAEADNGILANKIGALLGDGSKAAFEAKLDLGAVSLPTVHPSLGATLVLSDVDWAWSTRFGAFYSIGRIGLANFGVNDINAQYPGFIEIKKGADGTDEFHAYIEASDKVWVYFNYKSNQLNVVSSDMEVNNLINSKTNTKAKPGEYIFTNIDELEAKVFTDNFRANYKVPKKPAPKKVVAVTPKPVKKEEKKVEEDGF